MKLKTTKLLKLLVRMKPNTIKLLKSPDMYAAKDNKASEKERTLGAVYKQHETGGKKKDEARSKEASQSSH